MLGDLKSEKAARYGHFVCSKDYMMGPEDEDDDDDDEDEGDEDDDEEMEVSGLRVADSIRG